MNDRIIGAKCPACSHVFRVRVPSAPRETVPPLVPNQPLDRHYRLAELTPILGYSHHRLKHFCRTGKLKAYKIGDKGSPWLVAHRDVLDFAKNHAVDLPLSDK